jgi:hypothetical protein
MTTQLSASPSTIEIIPPADGYQPGVCNIGPHEIRRRRMAGHVGLAATIGALAVLVAVEAPPITRLLVALPAAIGASGYLQAAMKFCAGFAALGIFNFGGDGDRTSIADAEARAADRRRGRQISIRSFAIGLAVGVAAVLLPI